MSDRKKWLKILDRLWLRNFRVTNYYRMAVGAVRNLKLKSSLLDYAARRAQLSYEISQQMTALGGKSSLHGNIGIFGGSTISLNLTEENISRIVQKSIMAEKDCLAEYSKALSRVNDGATREILIRHRARISSLIKELQNLDALLPFPGENESLKTN